MQNKANLKQKYIVTMVVLGAVALAVGYAFAYFKTSRHPAQPKNPPQVKSAETPIGLQMPKLDFAAYDKKLMEIANNAATTASSTKPNPWPVKTVYPNYGALLPFNRIVAYYGNLYSKGMGVLGEYPEDVMLDKLAGEVKKWRAADPNTPVIPALHYIAVVAQAGGGKDGKYRARMPSSQIDEVLRMAKKINPATFCEKINIHNQTASNSPFLASSNNTNKKCGAGALVFLDIQVGQSNVQNEIPLLEKYLKLPNVHLGIDPEFAVKDAAPGKAIGALDASDINFAAQYLAGIVKENNLPPKILIVHRFTQKMLTNYKSIQLLPEAQIVMNMDGFGGQPNKLNTYRQFIYKEPVQFTGFKLFYKNDAARGNILTPEQLLKLTPIPVYIQYQ